jgi:predicted RND superfamily exporter protein
MSSTEPIYLDELPSSILDRYSNEDRDQFLVTVFPNGDIWKNAQFLARFVDDLERVSDKATGMPPVFKALIEVIGRDGQNAMLLTLVVVFLLLSVDFRNPLHSLMAMIPLALGVFWMVGIMKISGMMLTVMNVMAFPLIIGIGIDDGVHIVHRWRNEGKGKIGTVFSSTGKAILLTSLTTMLAFGSLVFSIWRGFGHLGGALFIGVGACFLTTVIILSGIFGLLERKKQS